MQRFFASWLHSAIELDGETLAGIHEPAPRHSLECWIFFPPMRKSKDFIWITPYFPRVTENRMRHCVLVLPNASLRLSIYLQFVIKEISHTDCLFVQVIGGWFYSRFSDCPSLFFKESWSFSTISWRTSLSMQSWRPMCSRASEKWAMPFSSAFLSSRLW